MINKEKIKEDKEEKSYKKDKSILPQVHEVEQKINAVEYFNNLSERDKVSLKHQIEMRKLRDNYASYVQYTFGANYIETKFHKMLCAICQNVVEKIEKGEQVSGLLSCPPQVGNSAH